MTAIIGMYDKCQLYAEMIALLKKFGAGKNRK